MDNLDLFLLTEDITFLEEDQDLSTLLESIQLALTEGVITSAFLHRTTDWLHLKLSRTANMGHTAAAQTQAKQIVTAAEHLLQHTESTSETASTLTRLRQIKHAAQQLADHPVDHYDEHHHAQAA